MRDIIRWPTGSRGAARRHLVVLAMAGLLALVLAPIGCVLWFAQEPGPSRADAAVVLGAAVYGRTPSPVLVERVRHAVELYKAGEVQWLVMTGGKVTGDLLSEAGAARTWAIAHGVPADRIIVETTSRTTVENLGNIAPLLAKAGIGRVLIVSDPLHMARALLIASRTGIEALPAPTPTSRFRSWRTQVPMLLREAVFLAQYAVTGT